MANPFPISTPSAPSVSAHKPQSVPQILEKLHSFGFCADLDLSCEKTAASGTSGESETALFDQMLSRFFLEIYKRQDSLPLPALLGDGRSIDLFRLYCVVQAKGGFKSVSSSSGWGLVAVELGFELGAGSSIKLVFFKYLGSLENWVERFPGERGWEDISFEKDLPKLCGSCLKEEVKEELTPRSGGKKEQFLSPCRGSRRKMELENGGSDVKERSESAKSEVNGGMGNNKRRRDNLVGLVNWVRMMAKNPCVDSLANVGSVADKGKAKPNSSDELFAQAMMFRKAVFLKRIRRSPDDSCIKNGALLESKGVNFNQNLQATSKQLTPGTFGNILKDNQISNGNGPVAVRESNHAKQRLRSSGLNFDQVADCLFGGDQQRTRVPVGSFFQAKVPAWTGKPSLPSMDSDELKWLGTKTWPPKNWESKSLLVDSSIGRGRSDNCQCVQRGSVECIRFHIAEKRLHLNRELGPAFYSWGFQRMGEEVALSWTEEEERKFKAIVRMYRPSLDKNFWDQLPLSFPSKGRRKLVSYYYNVFLLGRRSYQNRVTPNMIDSDDEESEFGFMSNRFGLAAITVHDSMSFICSQNSQPIEISD